MQQKSMEKLVSSLNQMKMSDHMIRGIVLGCVSPKASVDKTNRIAISTELYWERRNLQPWLVLGNTLQIWKTNAAHTL